MSQRQRLPRLHSKGDEPVDDVTWRKSRRSNDQGGECVEVAVLAEVVGVRDSKDPDGPKLLLAPGSFRALLTDLKRQ
ncbi:DUF397 domain-containing protein [Spirillospora sp. NPDC048824]|uniref:DUF397 domain-containing protein n=1 Tax=Spirillospora sp. NPDC048824 TaxID=3364526 RepID=UPI00371E5D2C